MVTRFQEQFLHHRLPFFDDVRLGRGDGDVEFYMVFYCGWHDEEEQRNFETGFDGDILADPKNVLKSLRAAMNAA